MAQATGDPGARPRGAAARPAGLPRDRAAGRSAPSRRSPPAGRAHDRASRGGVALPPVLVRAAAVHLQRLPAVADRALRLRPRSPATRAPRGCSTRPSPRRAREIPLCDVGDWSLYNYRGPESDRDYHELLREFLAEHVHAPARRALLRLRRSATAATRPTRRCSTLTGPSRAPRASRRASASTSRSCRRCESRSPADGKVALRQDRHLPPRRRLVRLDAARGRHLHGAPGRQGAAHRARA